MSDDLRNRVALLPCPFCGDPMEGNVTDCEAGFAHGPYGSLMVQCDNPECATLGPSSQTMGGAIAAWNTRADAALAGIGAVRVKPLTFRDVADGRMALSPVGPYRVLEQPDGFFDVMFDGCLVNQRKKGQAFKSYEAAEAWAQTRHQKQVTECIAAIEPAPVSVREAALKAQIHRLTAAGDSLTAWADDRGTPDVRKWDKARDEAFRAIAEGKE